MPVTKTKYIGDNRVLRTVKSDGKNHSFLDADIYLTAGFNTGSTPRWIKYDFGVVMPKVVYHLNWGDNGYLMKEFFNVSSVTIDIMPGINGNGGYVGMTVTNFPIAFFFSNPELIETMILSSNGTNNRPGWVSFNVNKRLVNLKTLKASPLDSVDIFSGLLEVPIEYLELSSDNPCIYSPSLAEQMLSLKYAKLNKFKGNNIKLNKFPPNLNYLDLNAYLLGTFDFKDYFTNNKRMGIRIGGYISVADNYTYSGGAIFPEHIVEESGRPVNYIIYLFNTRYMVTKPTPDMISQLLIDFANQVKSVTLANKRIIIQGINPNTSYTDLSQPIYTTYTDAFNYITNVLGVSVSFPP